MIPNSSPRHHRVEKACAGHRSTSAHRLNLPHVFALFGPSMSSFFLSTDILLDKNSFVSHAFSMAAERGIQAIPIGGFGEHRPE